GIAIGWAPTPPGVGDGINIAHFSAIEFRLLGKLQLLHIERLTGTVCPLARKIKFSVQHYNVYFVISRLLSGAVNHPIDTAYLTKPCAMRKNRLQSAFCCLALLFSLTTYSQTPLTLTGTVHQSMTKDRVPAVNVTIKGPSIGTYPDDHGNSKLVVAQQPPFV